MLTANKPIVRVTNTRPIANTWQTDGTVTFTVSDEDQPAASLTFEFQNAPNERAAVQQAAEKLRETAQGLLALAQRFCQ